MTFEQLNSDLMFVSDSQDVQAVRDSQGWPETEDYGSFFVRIADGDYAEIWGMFGIVPYNNRRVYRLL